MIPTSPHGPVATGRRHVEDDRAFVQFERTFRAPVEDVWAAVTEPDRLARWIGTWTGDPAAGEVLFQMTFEGDDVPEELFTIDECAPPYRLRITTSMPTDGDAPDSWRLHLDLSEADGVTMLRFAQDVPDPTMAESVGPGWDYYLDRMQVAEAGGDPATADFDDYYPALSEHYRAEFGSTSAP
ncbi:polyketide cyclase [Nocardioides sp. Root190]|uniref:SRPBCC family protein n=1 Tax=Nocardioides sp. Root190 TaxID=1736488 RepID=UPI0006FFAF71|nr:SRPBCC family protein [Nocardioides sp. Root190]KRB73244.1 polyketide cyclase [Nocardioides sp. Root190]